MKKSLFSLALSLSALSASAQVYTPPAGGGNKSGGTPSDTHTRSQPQNSGNQSSVLGNEIGVYNPGDDTISWNGNTWASSNNRLFEARFQKYLNEPEESSEAAKEYRATLREILDALSPHHKGGPSFEKAVDLLPRASSYPGDARLCDSLTNAIYTAVLSKKDVRRTKALMSAQERDKKRLISDGDWKARNDKDPEVGKTTKGVGQGDDEKKGQSGPAVQSGRGINSLEYAEYLRRIAEIEALKKTHQIKSEVKTELAKIQYQALMIQFFMQRRFEHVLMASRFYNLIWRDGDGTLYMDEKSEVNKLFTESVGTSPTVSTMDALASEAIRDIDKAVSAFLFLVESEELESASKRLAEAYLMGEFMPTINTLPREKKRKVLMFVREAYVLLNAIDAKDYAVATKKIEALKSMAKDFDATKAEAAVATYSRASDMHIMMAKNHLGARDTEKAREEIQKAMEIWPQNPKLSEFDKLVTAGGTMIAARNDFDRLFSESNYREVVKRQYEFAPAIAGDEDREAKFRQVIGNITEIERAVGGAKEMKRVGQPYAAWEKLDLVHEKFPDDPVLNQHMTQLAPSVADFTLALRNAATHERTDQVGSALSWFYQAKQLHPSSTVAQEGIDRLVDRALGVAPAN
ncbi:hypothetical protein N8522_02070 [Akkermansiaceae bacterium]|nr:hypothetical protein [Akkermansiaceae bacterium]MDB4265560.1 hypothetical protein [Akkermansiaceae bacterium]